MIYPTPNKRNLGEQAYEQIREAIITMEFKPGQMVHESALGQRLGMSRTPIREGIRMLLVEDLIEVLPQRGMRVSLISEAKVEDIRFVRESLEVSAFRKVATGWEGTERQYRVVANQLAQLLEDQQAAAMDADVMKFLYLDEEFHRVILHQAQNHTLISVVSQMRGHLNRVRILGLQQDSSRIAVLIDEHVQLFEAIRAQDEAMTVTILTHHLRRLSQDVEPLRVRFPQYFTL